MIPNRKFKTTFNEYRYENQPTKKQKEIFSKSPIELIENIFSAKARVSFCKCKINFYKIVTTEGETFENKSKLQQIDQECAKLLKKYGEKLN